METIKKYNENALVVETPQEVKREIYPIEVINAEVENHTAQLAYWQNLKDQATEFDLKTSDIINEKARLESEGNTEDPGQTEDSPQV